jgi:hypothetical protein
MLLDLVRCHGSHPCSTGGGCISRCKVAAAYCNCTSSSFINKSLRPDGGYPQQTPNISCMFNLPPDEPFAGESQWVFCFCRHLTTSRCLCVHEHEARVTRERYRCLQPPVILSWSLLNWNDFSSGLDIIKLVLNRLRRWFCRPKIVCGSNVEMFPTMWWHGTWGEMGCVSYM